MFHAFPQVPVGRWAEGLGPVGRAKSRSLFSGLSTPKGEELLQDPDFFLIHCSIHAAMDP